MEQHPIENLMGTSMESIREMVDVGTVIGDPVKTQDGSTIIPVSKVSFGFASGGSDFVHKAAPEKQPFAGGAGAGSTIAPIAFMVVNGDDIRMLHVSTNAGTVDKVIDSLPGLMNKTKEFFKKN